MFPLITKRWILIILAHIGIIAGLLIAMYLREQWIRPDRPQYRQVAPASKPTTFPTPYLQEIRERSWEKIEPHLVDAEKAGQSALDRHLATITEFLAERKKGTRRFASDLLGFRGKWELIVSRFRKEGNNEFLRWLAARFAEHLFRSEDLRQTVEATVQAYLSELQGIENQLLIRLRADVTDNELLAEQAIPALRSDAILRESFDRLMTQLTLPLLDRDMKVTAMREVMSLVGSEIATAITLKVGAAVMARLGASSGVITAGVASGWTTFGVGMVIGLVVDQAISQIMKAAGYDAEERIAARVSETLDDIGRTITDGDPEARATLEKLKRMQKDDPDQEVRDACPQAIRLIEENSCRLHGLRGELGKINATRASLRKEALYHLFGNTKELQ